MGAIHSGGRMTPRAQVDLRQPDQRAAPPVQAQLDPVKPRPSLSMRDERKPDPVKRDEPRACKSRPEDSRRKGGGGGSRPFVPWCR